MQLLQRWRRRPSLVVGFRCCFQKQRTVNQDAQLKAITNTHEPQAQPRRLQFDFLLIIRLVDSFHSLSICRLPICGKLTRCHCELLLLNDRLFWIILTVGIHPKFSAGVVSDWDLDSLL